MYSGNESVRTGSFDDLDSRRTEGAEHGFRSLPVRDDTLEVFQSGQEEERSSVEFGVVEREDDPIRCPDHRLLHVDQKGM